MTLTAGTKLGAYEILSPLGAGGMGEVYRARDPKLGRDVAIKVLPEAVAQDAERLARFEREARSLAALNHPGIVTIFAVEESAGTRFLAMELVEGEGLDTLIGADGLPLSRFFEVAVPLAEALSAAHERGIVHRDLKPGNVMVTGEGRVKVLDFGLAKLEAANSNPNLTSTPTESRANLTSEGQVFGTVAYMSPEQTRGSRVDARSDVFSLGAVLYQMATGERPFQGASAVDMISSILRDTPPSVTDRRADLPPHLSRVIRRCLEKEPRDRYQTSRDVYNELKDLRAETSSASLTIPPRSDAVVAEKAAPRSPRKRPARVAVVAAGALVLVAAIAVLWRTRHPAAPSSAAEASKASAPSIAVLPFVNQGGSADDEYFSDGMTDELASALTKVPGLRVAARSSAFTFKGKAADAREIGAKLNVGTVLEGTVRRSGSKLRVTVQLVNASDGLTLWSERYERDAKDVFAVQDDITGSIVAALRLTLGSGAPAVNRAGQTENAEAHDLYLRGRFLMFKQTEEGLRKALDYFEQALAKDPKYVPAYAGTAFAWAWLADATLAPREAYPKAKAAALKALELDPANVEARSMLAIILWFYDWDRRGSEEQFRRALESNPNSMDAHNLYATILCSTGQTDAGLAEIERAIALDPLNVWPSWTRELCLCIARRYDETIAQHKKSEELDPSFYYLDAFAGAAYREKKMYEEAVAEYQKIQPAAGFPLAGLAVTYARMGRTADARRILEELLELAMRRYVSPELVATIYASLGEKDQAFVWLQKGDEARSAFLPALSSSAVFDPLRSDPRFKALLKKMDVER